LDIIGRDESVSEHRFQAGGGACMKLHEVTIDEWWMSLAQRRRLRRVSLCFFQQLK